MDRRGLNRRLTTVEYFAFGFGTMVGVGWLVLIDDWLGRGGPGGAMLGFLLGGLLLLPVAHTYGRLVQQIPDAGAEIAYTEGVLPPQLSFAAGWTMVLTYTIVCPWEAVAIGNLLARAVPAFNTAPLYSIAGRTIYAPRLAAGLLLTGIIVAVNYAGIRPSGVVQDLTTFGLIALTVLFVGLGSLRGKATNLRPLFPRAAGSGAAIATLLVLQVVPYFMSGFESVAKSSEEARAGFDPRNFARAMRLAVIAGIVFYTAIIFVVAFIFPWREIVAGHLGSEAAFERAFGSRIIARLILLAAFLSLLKVFNGNFVAATRLVFAIGRRGLVHPSLARVHPRFGTPAAAVLMIGLLSAAASLLGDAALVPIAEVGSLAAGLGWLSACVAYLLRTTAAPLWTRLAGWSGATVSAAIVAMKIVPGVPGSFTRREWLVIVVWLALGLAAWFSRRRKHTMPPRI